jgi:hypothetical protein
LTAIWLLSTRGRPRECQETLDACEQTGMTSPGVVYVDETVNDYSTIRLPANWTIHYEPEWGSLQASLSWCFDRYPDATQYGWLADDTRPRTGCWDKQLEEAAGDWRLVCAKDLWLSESPSTRVALENGNDLSSGLCWGGELVRTVGWWALPGVRQAWIDVAWTKIVHPLHLYRYVDHVTVEHLNYRTGKRERDAVDDWSRGGDDYIERDIQVGREWAASDDYIRTIGRVNDRARVSFTKKQIADAVGILRDSYAAAHFTPGSKAAGLPRILAEFDASGKGTELAAFLSTYPDSRPSALDQAVRPITSESDLW